MAKIKYKDPETGEWIELNPWDKDIKKLRTDIGQTEAGAAGTGDMYIINGMIYAKDSSGNYVPLFVD